MHISGMSGQELLYSGQVLVKCKRVYKTGVNNAPCVLPYSKHRLCIPFNALQFSSVDLPNVRAFTLSTELVLEAGQVKGLQVFTRLPLLKRKRMGYSGEP